MPRVGAIGWSRLTLDMSGGRQGPRGSKNDVELKRGLLSHVRSMEGLGHGQDECEAQRMRAILEESGYEGNVGGDDERDF